MEAYIFNVLMNFSSWVVVLGVAAVVLYSIDRYVSKRPMEFVDAPKLCTGRRLSLGLIFGLVFSMGQSAYTWKNVTTPNRSAQQANYQQETRTRSQGEIVDRSRQPSMSSEERQDATKDLVDWKSRVEE